MGKEFDIEKCSMLINEEWEKDKTAEVTELPNQVSIWKLGEKENYKYLGILKADTIKQAEIVEK